VEVTGNARQQGFTQGIRFRHRMDASLRSLGRLPFGLPWLSPRARLALVSRAVDLLGRLYLPIHRPALRAHATGRYLRFLQGLAAGFSVAPARVYGFHAFELESGIVGYRMGCTALGFAARQTDTGAPKLAYNHDFPSAFRPHLVLRRTLSARAGVARSLSLTYEVLLGAIAGINEHGLAAAVNQAFARRPRRLRPALLPTTLVQDCLDHCRSVDEAVARLRPLPVNVGSLVTLVDAAGDRAVVELAPGGHAVRRAAGPHHILATFNQYGCPETRAQEIPVGARGTGLAAGYDLHEANLARQRRLTSLVDVDAPQAPPEPWSDARIHALLADHQGGLPGPNTLCRHDPDLGGDTIASAIFDPAARTVRLRRGWPCQGGYSTPIPLEPASRRSEPLSGRQ